MLKAFLWVQHVKAVTGDNAFIHPVNTGRTRLDELLQ